MKEAMKKRLTYVHLTKHCVSSILTVVERPCFLASCLLEYKEGLTPNQIRIYTYWVKTYTKYARRSHPSYKTVGVRVYGDFFDLLSTKFDLLYTPDYVRDEVANVKGA